MRFVLEPAEAAEVNPFLVDDVEHYLGAQDGPRMVLWYAARLDGELVGCAVSASPRGARCAGIDWENVVELARLGCTRRELTRVVLRLWRIGAAQDWADRYQKTIVQLAAYSDSSRHPGDIYRFDGWKLYDERRRGHGGAAERGGSKQQVAKKKLWVFEVAPPAAPKQQRIAWAS